MEDVPAVFAGFFALVVFIGGFSWIGYQIISYVFGSHYTSAVLSLQRGQLSSWDRKVIETTLLRHVPYYIGLSAGGKAKFINRVADHFLSKEFDGKRGLIVTKNMKALVSAGAVQLTFGLDGSVLSHFKRYVLFPRKFQLRDDLPEMHGATIPAGIIALNWKEILEGYNDPADGVNVVIHEFAHALVIQHQMGSGLDPEWGMFYDIWLRNTMKKLSQATLEERKHFRRNIVKKPSEVFPVIVEEFFERPKELRMAFPSIYLSLVALLHQDPLKKNNDFQTEMSAYRYYSDYLH